MRILQLHSDFIEYEPIRKEIAIAEEIEKKKNRLEEIVVLFTCVEEGDDEAAARKAIDEVKESLKELKVNKILIYPYAHLSSNLAKPSEALKIIKEMEAYAKEKGIETYRTPFGWCKKFSLSIKGHPLAEQSKIISPKEKVKKEKKVEWKFPKPEYLILTEEGKTVEPEKYKFKKGEENFKILVEKEVFKKEALGGEPRIIKILKRFGFEWEPSSDSGHMRYGPKASLMVDLVGEYAWQSSKEIGLPSFSIKGTNLFNLNLPPIKKHADLFGERLYTVKVDNEEFILRYAACFQQFSMLKDWNISYKQIPFGMFEIADSYRFEQSGECLLGFRLRRFYMPDYHIFCKNLDQAKEISIKVHEKIYEKIRELGAEYVSLYNLTKSFFEENKEFLKKLVKIEKKPVLLHFVPEEKYYWLLNVEYNIIDELKRPREISTFQIDVGNAKRFGIKYVDEKGKEVFPPILHIAILGGIERYIFTVLDIALREKNPILPLWLSPTQVRIIPLSDKYIKASEKIAEEIEKNQIRVDIDDRNETVSKKIRDAELEWIPAICVVGSKEVKMKTLAVRLREEGKIKKMKIKDLIKMIKDKVKGKPFKPLPLPKLLSKRPIFVS
jgi:threonyl-tRNA synthetase